MLIVLSPAKNLDFERPVPSGKSTRAALLDDAAELAAQLKTLSPHKLSALMGISDKLGKLNFDRYQQWQLPLPADLSRQAIFAFNGDVYSGLAADTFSNEDLAFAQAHLRILSGLYGVLRPLDQMLAYRLEMGTKLKNPRGADLYAFWGERITDNLNAQLKKLGSHTLVNLASGEYFKAVRPTALKAEVITPVFKDWKSGQYKVISFLAKKARGRMSAYSVKHRITDVETLKHFDWDGYKFDAGQSTEREWVFTRKA